MKNLKNLKTLIVCGLMLLPSLSNAQSCCQGKKEVKKFAISSPLVILMRLPRLSQGMRARLSLLSNSSHCGIHQENVIFSSLFTDRPKAAVYQYII